MPVRMTSPSPRAPAARPAVYRACQRQGVKTHWQPFPDPDFIQKSVVSYGEAWRSAIWMPGPGWPVPIRAAPEGWANQTQPPTSTPTNVVISGCSTALTYGVDKVRFVCLWNGSGGDGPRWNRAYVQ